MTEFQGWLLLAMLACLVATRVDENPRGFFVIIGISFIIVGVLQTVGFI